MIRFAAPIGPCGSSTPPEQPVSDKSGISAIDIRNGTLRQVERCHAEQQEIDDLSSVALGTRFITDSFGDALNVETNPYRAVWRVSLFGQRGSCLRSMPP